MWGNYVCNDINVVTLRFEKQPKLTKEQPIVNFFNFFQRHSTPFERNFTVILKHIEVLSKTPYDSNENLYSLFTLCGGSMCAMTLTWIGWDLRKIAKNDQGNANCELLQFFSKFVFTIRTNISTAFLHYVGDLCVQ